MLYDLRIITHLGNTTHVSFARKQLTHGSGDNLGKSCKARLIVTLRKPAKHIGKVEDKDINVVIFDRYIAPSTSFQTNVSQHLSLRKGYIPSIIPR